jgi:hypothetical protein
VDRLDLYFLDFPLVQLHQYLEDQLVLLLQLDLEVRLDYFAV